MAMSGTVSSSGYEGRRIDLTWTATHDKANNRSLVKWTLKGAGGNSSYYYMAGGFKVTINGTVVYISHLVSPHSISIPLLYALYASSIVFIFSISSFSGMIFIISLGSYFTYSLK